MSVDKTFDNTQCGALISGTGSRRVSVGMFVAMFSTTISLFGICTLFY